MGNHIVWCSLNDFYQQSKSASWRARAKLSQESLFRYLKDKNLVMIEVLSETGEAIPELSLRESNLTQEGKKFFEKAVPAWQRARDKDGDYANTGILKKVLETIRTEK